MSKHIRLSTNGEMIDEDRVQDSSVILNSDDDPVSHPSHYQSYVKGLNIEAIDCMRAAFGDEAVQNFCICNALKYLFRHQSKGGKTDLLKCKWYIDKYLELGGEDVTE